MKVLSWTSTFVLKYDQIILYVLQNVLHELEGKKPFVDSLKIKGEKLQQEANAEQDKNLVKDKGRKYYCLRCWLRYYKLPGSFRSWVNLSLSMCSHILNGVSQEAM